METRNLFVLKIICYIYITTTCATQYMNPEWVPTHAWANEKDPLKQICPQQTDCKNECLQNSNANTAYKRLVKNIFDKKYYRKDDSTKYFYRTLHIHATEEQLEKLSKLTDTDDIDGLVAEILAQTKFGTFQIVKEYTVDMLDVIRPSFNFEIPSRTKYLIVNFTLLLFAYLVCRRFNISFLLVVLFGAGYLLYEYLDYECHKRIAIEETVDFLYGSEKNPCESKKNPTWWDFLLGRGSRSECKQYLEKANRSTKKCGMVDLFHEFTSNILYKQLSLFFNTLAELVQSVNNTYGILITAITIFFMKDLLKTIIYSVFKYLINPSIWSNVYSNVNSTGHVTHAHSVSATVETLRIQSITSGEPDIRDVNLGKALDLANNRIKLALLESTSSQIPFSENIASSVQLLSIDEANESSESTSTVPSESPILPSEVNEITLDTKEATNEKGSDSQQETEIIEEKAPTTSKAPMASDKKSKNAEKNDVEALNKSDKSASSDNSDNSDYVVL